MNDGENLRVVARYSAPNTSEIQNVFFYQYTGAGDDDADVLAECDTFFTNNWGDDWAAQATSDMTLDSIDLDVLKDNGDVKRNIGTAIINVPGDLPEDGVSSGVSSLITADTALPKQRGRKYVPGATDNGIVDNLLVAARLATLALLTVEYLASITGTLNGTLDPGVLSRTLGSFQPFISAGTITDVPAYQRRRKPGVGS